MAPQDAKRSRDKAYFVKRPEGSEGRKILGGYTVNEEVGENGGVVVAPESEAQRIAGYVGWDYDKVDAHKYPVQETVKAAKKSMGDGPGIGDETKRKETLRSLAYQTLKKECETLMAKGAPDIKLNSPKDSLVNYLIQYKPLYSDKE